jgi:hypothetical protein
MPLAATAAYFLPAMSVPTGIYYYWAKRTRRASRSCEEFEQLLFMVGTHTTIHLLWQDASAHTRRSMCCGITRRLKCLTDTLTDVGHPVTDQDFVVNTMLLILF